MPDKPAYGLQFEFERLTSEIDKIAISLPYDNDRMRRLRTLRAAVETELRRRGDVGSVYALTTERLCN